MHKLINLQSVSCLMASNNFKEWTIDMHGAHSVWMHLWNRFSVSMHSYHKVCVTGLPAWKASAVKKRFHLYLECRNPIFIDCLSVSLWNQLITSCFCSTEIWGCGHWRKKNMFLLKHSQRFNLWFKRHNNNSKLPLRPGNLFNEEQGMHVIYHGALLDVH